MSDSADAFMGIFGFKRVEERAMDKFSEVDGQSTAPDSDAVQVPRELPALIDRLDRVVEVFRECEQIASRHSGSLLGVELGGGDDNDDPICAVFHRLYYAMYDADEVRAELRDLLNGGQE